jgi:hypothetical protein
MRYVAAWVAALVCAGLGSSSIIASIAQGGTIEVGLTLDFDVHQTPISPTLVGVGLSADNQGNGVAAGGVSAAAIASTAQLRAKMMRFPDDISQSYHWELAAAAGHMTTFEFFSLATGAEVPNLMATVNMVDGTPDEAARWVAMANQPMGSQNATRYRQSPEPYDIGYWLLGEDISAHPEKFPTAQSYAAAAVENATKMRAAFPSIKIGLWLEDGTTTERADYNTALLTTVRQRDPYQNGSAGARLFDFVGVAVDVRVPDRPLSDAALYPSLYAYAAQRANEVVSAAELASTTVLLHELPVAVYRYGIDFGDGGWNHDKADSLGAAVALSGMLDAFAKHDKLLTAIYAGLNGDGFGALLQVPTAYNVAQEQRFATNPFANVLASYGQFLTGKTVNVDLSGAGGNPARARYRAPQVGGTIPAADNIAVLSTQAALDASLDQLALFIASRSPSDRVVAHVVLNHTLPASFEPTIVSHVFQSPSLSTDTYTGISHLEAASEVKALPIATAANGDLTFDLTIERNSIALFTFTVKNA